MLVKTPKRRETIEYPSSDGEPMAETDLHREWMFRSIHRLQRRYRGKRVYVSGNLLVYYEKGNAKRHFSPDTFVVKGIDPKIRDTYLLWIEGKPPDFCLETTSKTTRRVDLRIKSQLYAKLGVKEYFLYDPTSDWLVPPLAAYQLVRGKYEPIQPTSDGKLLSRELGLYVYLEDSRLVMEDVKTGERLMDDEEARDAAEQRAQTAEQRAQTAEQTLKELKEEIQRLRQELGRKPNGRKS